MANQTEDASWTEKFDLHASFGCSINSHTNKDFFGLDFELLVLLHYLPMKNSKRWAHGVSDTFAKYPSLVYDVTD